MQAAAQLYAISENWWQYSSLKMIVASDYECHPIRQAPLKYVTFDPENRGTHIICHFRKITLR